MSGLPPVCILAGGLGTRLGDRAKVVPKVLTEVAGEPFVHHQLRLLAREGAERVVLSIGHLGEQVEEVVGDGSRFGLDIAYSHDGPTLLGTAGAVRKALPQLGDEFLVLYGDTYLHIDHAAVVRARRDGGWPAVMTVLRNEGRWDTSNASWDGTGAVRYDKHHPTADMEWIDYGLAVLTREALTDAAPEAPDLADVYAALTAAGELGGYEATVRFHEIGTPSALAETDVFLRRDLR
jgi:NDP-sugar pyrophosphorylase family protein